MGAPAISQPAEPAQTAPETPAVAPAAAPEPSGQSTQGGGEGGTESGAQSAPQGVSQPAAPPVDPAAVPYARFKDVQTAHTQLKRQIAEMERRYGGETETLRKQIAEMERYKNDYTEIDKLIADNPDLADQLMARARARGGTPPARAEVEPPKEFQELRRDVATVKEWLASQRQQTEVQRQAEADRVLASQLDGTLTKFLGERQYKPEVFLDDVRNYVFFRAMQLKEQGKPVDLEDVPYLAGEWLKRKEIEKQHWLDGIRSGKQAAAGIPASPGPTPASVSTPSVTGDAFGPKTKAALEEALKARLGW